MGFTYTIPTPQLRRLQLLSKIYHVARSRPSTDDPENVLFVSLTTREVMLLSLALSGLHALPNMGIDDDVNAFTQKIESIMDVQTPTDTEVVQEHIDAMNRYVYEGDVGGLLELAEAIEEDEDEENV